MSFRTTFMTGLAALALILPVTAQAQMAVEGAYARSSGPMAQSGAAFMTISNRGRVDDRLVGVASGAAARVELHSHIADENGIMRMRRVEAGLPIAAGSAHVLQRGGDHVMFMGLTGAWSQGDTVTVTLIFEHAGPIEIDISVDLERSAGRGQTGN